MFITAVCVLFLIKLRWPRNKSLYHVSNCCQRIFRKSHQIWKQNERCELQEYNGMLLYSRSSHRSRVDELNKLSGLPSVSVFTAQLVEHCSANAEATGSYHVEALKKLFFGLFRNCLNCHSLRWSHIHFGSVCFSIRKDC